MRKFKLEIVSPDGPEFTGEVESLLVRTDEGDVEILAGHADYLAALAIGRTRLIENGKERYASSAGGFLSVARGEVKMAVTTFEFADDIDVERARKAKEKAEQRQKNAKDSRELAVAEAKLKRALNRLNVSEYK